VGTIWAHLFFEIKQYSNVKTVAKSGESSGSAALGTPLPTRNRLSQTRTKRASKWPKNPKGPIRTPIHILHAANNHRGTSLSGLSIATVESALEVNLDLTTKTELDSFTYSKFNLLVILSG
jgi:hypothetical protein